MSIVTEVRELHKHRGSSRDKDALTSKRVYLVKFNQDGGTPEEAEVANDGARSIPTYGSILLLAGVPRTLREIKARPVKDSRRLFRVDLVYKATLGSSEDDPEDPDPLSRPPDISWRTNKYQRVFEKDINDNTVLNSAEDPFDPPPMKTVSVAAVDISINYEDYDPDFYLPFVDSTNDATGTIASLNNIPVKGAWMEDILHRTRYESGIKYHRVTYKIEFAGNYIREILDRGWHRLPDGAEEDAHYLGSGVFQKVEITNADGTMPNRPVLLDGMGQPLANGAAPVYLNYEDKEPKDWGPLGLPASV